MKFLFQIASTLVLLSGVALIGGVSFAQSLSESSDDPTLLRGLAEYFARVEKPRDKLIVGRLPDFLPSEVIPIPDDTRILGSMVRNNSYAQVVLDSEQSPNAIADFYQEELLSAGWQMGEIPSDMWDFITPTMEQAQQAQQDLNRVFCNEAGNLALSPDTGVFGLGQPNIATLVIMSGESNVRELGCPSDIPTASALPTIPTLQLPDGVDMITSNSGVDENFVYTDALVKTSLSSEVLLSHFSEQFEQANWLAIERVDDDRLSLTTWTTEDEQGQTWKGALNVIKLQGVPGDYLLQAQAERQ